MPRPDLIRFSNADQMTTRLEQLILMALRLGIAESGRATMALSGGSSPKVLYERLSCADIEWSKVDVTLVDERWVAPGDAGSNEQFICDTLLQNRAAAANFKGMYAGDIAFEVAADMVAARLAPLLVRPFDVVVMGMGPDGHTASWFPGAENLDQILTTDAPVATSDVPQTDVTGKYLERVTLTPTAIEKASTVLLPLTGPSKEMMFERARREGEASELPVRALLDRAPQIWACWAP